MLGRDMNANVMREAVPKTLLERDEDCVRWMDVTAVGAADGESVHVSSRA